MAAGTVERFTDAGGLFKVRLDILGATPAARQGGAVFLHPRPEHTRARLSRRQAAGRALRRYCSGCARETEHVPWSSHGPAHIASIRWPVAEPAGGTTICQDCGQVRVAATRPTAPAWSSWPKTPGEPAARRNGKPTEPVSAPPPDEGASEAARRTSGYRRGWSRRAKRRLLVRTRADLRRIEAPPPRAVIWSTR